MRRVIVLKTALIALAANAAFCLSATGQTFNVDVTDRGWYDETGFSDPSIIAYIAGDFRGSGCQNSGCSADIRDFFVFNLSSVPAPIASAKLALSVPPVVATPPGYSSADPSENFELHDVTTSISALLAGTGGVAAHTDLGSGIVYGNRSMSAADNGTVVEIPLNSAAVAAMNASSGLFGMGGSITTLDSIPNEEYEFGWSFTTNEIVQLRLSLVPEPSSATLCILSALSLICVRKRVGKS